MEKTTLELTTSNLDELRKQVIGYFRFHNSANMELVTAYDGKIVDCFHLTDRLGIRSHSVPTTSGVIVLFDPDETLYTLRTTRKTHLLEKYYERVMKPGLRPKEISAYMVPGL